MYSFLKGPRRMEVTPGFLLLLAGLGYLDEGTGLLPWALLACAVHELGHLATAKGFGGSVARLKLSVVGAELSFRYPMPLSYGQENLVLLSGPLANLLLAPVAFWWELPILAVSTVWIGAFNLMPIPPLDGGRLAENLLEGYWNLTWAPTALAMVSGVLAGGLAGIGAIAAVVYGNVTLLLTAAWLLWGIPRTGRR